MEEKPWCQGPKELLNHAIEHLKIGKGFDIRIAMISIDNAIELMIKTYLELPERITDLNLSRKELEEYFENFPKLLKALEKYVPNILSKNDFNDIEYFHRVRNDLYHGATALTIERDKTEAYLALAELLYQKLFYPETAIKELTREKLDKFKSLIRDFIINWDRIEKMIFSIAQAELNIKKPTPLDINLLVDKKIFGRELLNTFNNLKQYRNQIIHGSIETNVGELAKMTYQLEIFLDKLEKWVEKWVEKRKKQTI